jgi:hypothetical protein
MMKLTVNMRLLVDSDKMTPDDRVKAEAFAEWLLSVGEGRQNMTPLLELPSGTFELKSSLSLTS